MCIRIMVDLQKNIKIKKTIIETKEIQNDVNGEGCR